MIRVLVWVVLALWALAPLAGYLIGSWKGRPWVGWYLGLFLSVLGLALIAFVPPTEEALERRAQLARGHGGHTARLKLTGSSHGHHRHGGRHAR